MWMQTIYGSKTKKPRTQHPRTDEVYKEHRRSFDSFERKGSPWFIAVDEPDLLVVIFSNVSHMEVWTYQRIDE